MKNTFITRVINERVVDTKKYRYVWNGVTIERIELDKLDTTAVLTDWVTVYERRAR